MTYNPYNVSCSPLGICGGLLLLGGVDCLKVNIANHDGTIQWDGTYFFGLSDYPNISKWELHKLIYLMEYEKSYDRALQIDCENKDILDAIAKALAYPEEYRHVPPPEKITECTACKHNGCLTAFVCHTATIDNAKSILSSGKLLSAVKAFRRPASELVRDQRNAAGDTADYFDYIMFAWGNCQAGDRLVMERMLNRSPDEQDLSLHFQPGVRFYFRYKTIASHPSFVFDGYHPAKIKDELSLSDCLFACVIPYSCKSELENVIPEPLQDKVFYIKNDCQDIWEWSEKVYDFVLELCPAKESRSAELAADRSED